MKITKLTAEQELQLTEYAERWTNIGLSVEPTDRPRAEAGVKLAYETAGLKPPRIVWCQSPMSGALTRAIIKAQGDELGASVRASVRDSVRDSVGDSVRASVGASVWASVRDSVRASVRDAGYGQHDANWLSFYAFFAEQCGLVAETEKLKGLWEIAQSAGWFWPCENICWITDRPHTLKRDEQGRLHCDDGPALQYPDGWGIWAVHGVRVPDWIIEKPENITAEEIHAETNAEIRRVMINRFGQDRLLRESHASLQDESVDTHGEPRKLWRLDVPDDEPIVMIELVNKTPEPDGTVKHYFLRVPPETRTAQDAQLWVLGIDLESTKSYTVVHGT